MGGLLTPEQIDALSRANTINLIIGLLLLGIPSICGLLIVMVRGNNEIKKGQQELEKQQLALEERRIDGEVARDKAGERQAEIFMKASAEQVSAHVAAVKLLADEMKALRIDSNNELDDVRAGMVAIPQRVFDTTKPLFDKQATDHSSILTGIDDTKNRIQAIADSHAALLNKIDGLPQSIKIALQPDIASLATLASSMKESLTSFETTLALIYGKVTETPVTQVPPLPALPEPPKTETSLPTLAAETGATP